MMVRVRCGAVAVAIAFGVGLVSIAHAETFSVPAGSLGEVAVALGVQAGVTITVTEPDVAAQHSPGVSGNLPLRAALALALRGTDAEAVFYDTATIRIVRRRAPPPTPEPAPASSAVEQPDEIVVTASKQGMLLNSYPGSVKLIELEPGWVATNAADGTAAVTRLLPSLSSTNLGSGRDKLFIRGIADSSFNGPSQATVGQYLGDVRLNNNAPDPNLNLYDMKRVEVLVGPQGTLYGAGSLGGIIRLVPNTPDAHELSATVSADTSSTHFGGISGDGAGMLNVPLVDGHVAVRLVGYGTREGGYIDDPSRGLQDINSTASYGQRFNLRVEDLSGWTLDFGDVLQNIASADGQYVLRGDPPLTRKSAVAQPFSNNYRLYYITARATLGNLELVSTTSAVWQNLQTVFDATGQDGTTTPARFKDDDDVFLVSHETRISGGNERAPWVCGVTTLFSSNTLSRSLGPLNAATQIAGVVNVQAEAALFGQISHPFTRTLTGTIGERLTFANSTGVLIDNPADALQRASRDGVSFSNTLALDWHPAGPLSAFFHYQQGYRPGGLAVAPAQSGIASQRFAADDLNMDEIGIRLGDAGHDRLSLHAAGFFTDWNHMQADLVDTNGLPYTTNIGRGRIHGLDGEITWRALPALDVSAAAFVNDSRLTAPAPEFVTTGHQSLPNVAGSGARIAIGWHEYIAPGIVSSGQASVRYVGTSKLGVGQYLDILQGNYFVADTGARLDFGNFALSLSLDNLADVRANTFAFGNPFGVAQRDQMTPLRPRTIRLGVDARY